jgi:hypothetical protein
MTSPACIATDHVDPHIEPRLVGLVEAHRRERLADSTLPLGPYKQADLLVERDPVVVSEVSQTVAGSTGHAYGSRFTHTKQYARIPPGRLDLVRRHAVSLIAGRGFSRGRDIETALVELVEQ